MFNNSDILDIFINDDTLKWKGYDNVKLCDKNCECYAILTMFQSDALDALDFFSNIYLLQPSVHWKVIANHIHTYARAISNLENNTISDIGYEW